MSENSGRILYFDYLRIFAIFAVIILHVSAEHLWDDVASTSFLVHDAFNSVTRWAVPVFVMISGALFLDPDREISLGRLHRKNLLRIVTAFGFWSLLYSLVDYVQGGRLRDVVFDAVKGHVHLWYLIMLAGLYIVVPILRKVTESKKTTEYFLVVWFLLVVCIQTAVILADFIGSPYSKLLSDVSGSLCFRVAGGYAGYFVLGYYLNSFGLSDKKRIAVYFAGIFGFVLTFALPIVYFRLKGKVNDSFSGNFTVNVFLEALSVFVFFKYAVREKTGKTHGFVRTVSDCTFGIYLVHMLIVKLAGNNLGIDSLSFNPVVSIPVIALCVFILSFAVIFIIRKIPFINRYIV